MQDYSALLPLFPVGGRIKSSGMMMNPFRSRKRCHVAVIRLTGVIEAGSGFGSSGLNDVSMAPVIERAFTRGKPRAVALQINSPGGSPVQSSLIAARIRRLAAEKDIPVYGFCDDVAASGGYWLATAADEIYADENSIVGSIGVITASFGFQELIKRHGIERRVYTAGENKLMLDSFQPENPNDVKRLKHIHSQMHESFIAQVKSRRGARLKRDDVFTGDIWTGREAAELGLVDGVGHLVPTMKRIFGDKVTFSVVTPKRSLWRRFGGPGASDVLAAVEERSQWARYGL